MPTSREAAAVFAAAIGGGAKSPSPAARFPREATYGNRPRSGTVYSCASHGLADAEITVEALHAAAALLAQGRLT